MRGARGMARVVGGLAFAFALLMALALMPQRAAAATYPCTEAGLNSALAAGGTATFSCGTATTITITGGKTVSRNVTLDGGGLLTISGNNQYQVFTVNGGVTFGVANLTITGGNAGTSDGGGIDNNGTTNVTNSTITNNTSVLSATVGGGIYNNTGGMLTVTNSILATNSAPQGGGIDNNPGGTVTVTNSTFISNSTTNANGGGIANFGSLTITNSTFANNTALAYGGGLYNHSSETVTVTNSTLSHNSGNLGAGGIRCDNPLTAVKNTLIVNNPGGDVSACGTLDPSNRTGTFTFASALTDNGGPTQTFAIGAGSPAYHAGDATACTPLITDQRGVPRDATHCSLGAFEPETPTVTLTGPATGAYSQPLTLTATLAAAITLTAPTSGTVSFTDNGTAITGCTMQVVNAQHQANCATSALGVGTHANLTASYTPDAAAIFAAGGPSNAVSVNITPVACVVTSVMDPSEMGKVTLRDAVNVANVGGCTNNTITFDPATNGTPITLTNGALSVTHTVTVTGNGAGQTQVTQSGNIELFYVSDGSFTASALSLSGGTVALNWFGSAALSVSDTAVSGATFAIADRGSGTITVTRSLFTGNGKAIYGVGASTITVTNSTFSTNTFALDNAAETGGTVAATNDTFLGNLNGVNAGSNLTVTRSVLTGNTQFNCGGVPIDGGGNVAYGVSGPDTTCPATFTRTQPSLLDATLRLNGATNGIQTFALLPGSPAIDASAGACGGGITVDSRNLPRTDGKCDSGAFESRGFSFAMPTGTPQSTAINTAFPAPLGLTVSSSHGEPVVGGAVTFTGPMSGADITPDPVVATITGTAGASTGTISQGVTANGTTGSYTVTASASGVPTAGNVTYTLTNTQAPAITSASSMSDTEGTAFSFTVTTTGSPTPALSESGALPMGVTFIDNGNGTATLAGTPTATGTFMLTFTASNGVQPNATQAFTLTVAAPQLTGLTVTAPIGGSGNSGTATMPVLRTGASFTLIVVGMYNNGTTGSVSPLMYTVTSGGHAVQVDGMGKVTGIAAGMAVITVSGPNGTSTTITIAVTGAMGSGLTNPNAQPMAHATVAVVTVAATPAPQPASHPIGGSGGGTGGVVPNASGATPTPQPQPGRHA